jgi:hypothetical protein
MGVLYVNPRICLRNYPLQVRAAVTPMTPSESRANMLVGLPFLAFMVAAVCVSTWDVKRSLLPSAGFGELNQAASRRLPVSAFLPT